jgi:glutaredoxin 2
VAKSTKMSTPVTRGELQQELREFKRELTQELDRKLESFATKKDLESFATKKDLESFATKKDFESFATKKDLENLTGALLARMDGVGQQLQADLARHAGALREWMSTLMAAHDEKYADLPGRVRQLEATAFGDERR